MRTTIAAMSGLVVGRPGRRLFEPSYFLADESPVPPQDRVGCHDGGDGREVAAAEDMAFHGETASLVVGQPQSLRTVHRAEDPVLLEQVLNDGLLMTIDPAREQQEEEGERARQQVHGESLPERRPLFNRLRKWASCAVILVLGFLRRTLPPSTTSMANFTNRSAVGRVFAQHADVRELRKTAVTLVCRYSVGSVSVSVDGADSGGAEAIWARTVTPPSPSIHSACVIGT